MPFFGKKILVIKPVIIQRRKQHMDNFMKAVKKELAIKKIILIIILLAGLVFTIMQAQNFNSLRTFFNNEKVKHISSKTVKEYEKDPQAVDEKKDDYFKYQLSTYTSQEKNMKGNSVITQTFTAKEDEIRCVNFIFNNPQGYTGEGVVKASILDEKGKQLCSASVDVTLIRHQSITYFDFIDSSESVNKNNIISKSLTLYTVKGISVNKGDRYTLKLESKNIKVKGRFGIYLCEQDKNKDDRFTYNGNREKQGLLYGAAYVHFNLMAISIIALAYIIAMLLILLPIDSLNSRLSIRRKRDTDLNKTLSRVMFVLSPFASFFIIEKAIGFSSFTIVRKLFTPFGFYNILTLVCLLWLFYTICNRIKYASTTLAVTAGIFGFLNFMLIQFRNSPLQAMDIASVGTAIDVAGTYTLIVTKAMLWSLSAAIIYVCLNTSLRQYKSLKGRSRIIGLIVMLMLAGSFYCIILSSWGPSKNIKTSGFNPKRSYKNLGSSYAFALTGRSSVIKKPKGYSIAKVKKITEKYESDACDGKAAVSRKTPNVIVVMNESFTDLSYLGSFKTSADYIPFVRGLKKNTIKGTLHTSVFGGQTANTEYEFLTGNSLAFLPYALVPYNTKVHENTPSLARTMTSRGYGGNVAFHPGMQDSYNRNNAYPNLGFDKFISFEDLKDPELVRAYVSDKADYDVVISQYEKFRKKNKTKPFWMFNVTIQNHGNYKFTNGVLKRKISIRDNQAWEESAEQYLNLVKISDDAFKDLLSYYKKESEPTIVVMFGDHEPRLGDSFYSALKGRNSDETGLQRLERRYKVPFVIWGNFDIKEEKNIEISANYLSSYLLYKTGGQMTGYNKYLMDLYKKIPVITQNCCIDNGGKIYCNNVQSGCGVALKEYQMIQYNNVVDCNNRIEDFFRLK